MIPERLLACTHGRDKVNEQLGIGLLISQMSHVSYSQ